MSQEAKILFMDPLVRAGPVPVVAFVLPPFFPTVGQRLWMLVCVLRRRHAFRERTCRCGARLVEVYLR